MEILLLLLTVNGVFVINTLVFWFFWIMITLAALMANAIKSWSLGSAFSLVALATIMANIQNIDPVHMIMHALILVFTVVAVGLVYALVRWEIKNIAQQKRRHLANQRVSNSNWDEDRKRSAFASIANVDRTTWVLSYENSEQEIKTWITCWPLLIVGDILEILGRIISLDYFNKFKKKIFTNIAARYQS